MIDNFFQQSYHSFDQVYINPETGNCLFLGDAQSAMDCDFHLNNKIRTIVTAAKNMEHIIVGQGINHITYPLVDGKNQNISAFFERFFELVETNIKKGNVLIHCAAGISRSATLVISYLMRKEKMTFKEAISYVRKSRPNVLPNLGFERQLKKYEEQLLNMGKNSRNSRRSQVRTSESGKSETSLRSQALPFVAPFSNMPHQNQFGEKIRRFMDKFSEKDIQILKIYHNGHNFSKDKAKNMIKARLIHLNKGKSVVKTVPENRVLKTEMTDNKSTPFYNIFKHRNKRQAKSKIFEEAQEFQEQKKTDPFVRKIPSERGRTADHPKKR